MCQQLIDFRNETTRLADAFDPALLSLSAAQAFVVGATAIENAWAAMKALAAARAAECADQRPAAKKLAAERLARTTGTSLGGARNTLEVGRRLRAQRKVAAAARRGELSASQTAAITDAVAADPTAERRLLNAAANGSSSELRDECARVKAAAELDPDKRQADIRAARHLRNWTDAGGAGHLHASGNVGDMAQIMAAINPIADQFFDHARSEDRYESYGAYAFDALVELALTATSTDATRSASTEGGAASPGLPDAGPGAHCQTGAACPSPGVSAPADTGAAGTGSGAHAPGDAGAAASARHAHGTDVTHPATGIAGCDPDDNSPKFKRGVGTSAADTSKDLGSASHGRRRRRGAPVKLQLRIDLDTWLRGFPVDGEVCELVGHGPVPVSVVRKLVAQGDPFVVAILTKAQAVVGVARLGRRPTSYQRSALEWLYPSCAVQGCPAQAHLQIDHRADWAKTRFTMFGWLDRLCINHHNLKTRAAWALVDGIGKRPFVPPDDPRHPRHQPPAAA